MTIIATYLQLLHTSDFNSALDNHKLQELFTQDIKADERAKILKLLTKAVSSNTVTNTTYDENIFRLSSHMLEFLQNEVGNIDESILSCVYYITKHFLKQENLELALKLNPFVLSLKIEVTENVIKAYYGIFYEFDSYLKKHKDIPSDIKLKIQCESLEILSLCGVKYLPTFFCELEKLSCCDGTISVRQDSIIYLFSLVDNVLQKSIVDEQCQVVCKWYIQCVSGILPFVMNEPLIRKKVLCSINIFQTSNATCNKLMSFFIKSIKTFLISPLSFPGILEQISTLKSLLVSESNFLLHCVCSKLGRIYHLVLSNWLKTEYWLRSDFCLKTFLSICELGLLLCECCTRKYTIDQEISYGDCLRCIVVLIPLGIHIVCSHVKERGKNGEVAEETVNNIFKKLLLIQTQCLEHIFNAKNSGKDFWKDTWKALASQICSLASLLEQKCYFDFACDMYKNVCCPFCMLEQIEDLDSLISPLEVVIKAFKGLSQCFVHQLKPKEALITLSIAVLFFPENCSTLQKLWMISKKNASYGESCLINKKFTMCNIFQELNSSIKFMFPLIFARIQKEFNHSNIYQLLVWELQSYMLSSDDMFESVCEVSRLMMLHPHDSIAFVHGIVMAMRVLWRQIDSYGSESFQHLCETGLRALSNLKKDSDWQIQSLMGDIYFYKFWAEITVLRKKLQDEVGAMKTKYSTREERSIMKGFTDIAEAGMKSNIVTVYSDLNVDKEQELLKILLQAIEFWHGILNFDLNVTKCTQGYVDNLLLNIKTTAVVFALYGYYIHSLKVWKIYYSFCKTLKDNLGILFALSKLLTSSSYLPEGEFWEEADRIEEDLVKEIDLGIKQKEVLLSYRLTKCNSCFLRNQLDAGWQYLLKIDSAPRTVLGYLCLARKNILLSKYYLLCPHSSKIPNTFKDGNSFLAIGEALRNLKALCLRRDLDPLFEKCTLHLLHMEAAEWMGDLCLGGKFYRDGYVYLKEDLFLAQKLGLASRCSLIVSKLAQFDLMCWETDNLQVKLLSLEAILCLNAVSASSFKFCETAIEEKRESYMRESSADHDFMTVKLLDVPVPARFAVMSSPNLKSSPFKTPYIANHEDDCLCLSCYSLILQSVFVDVSYFQAHVNVFKGENELALTFFKGGMKLGECLKKKQEKLAFKLISSVFPDQQISLIPFSGQLCTTLTKLSLSFKEFLFLYSKFKQMEKISPSPEIELKNSQECNFHLVLDVLDRTLLMNSEIDVLLKSDEKAKRQLFCDVEPDYHMGVNNLPKTPSSSREQLLQAPARNRNEEHLHISQLASPSLVVNLKSKMKEEKTKRGAGKNITRQKKKIDEHTNGHTQNRVVKILPKIPDLTEDRIIHGTRKNVRNNLQDFPPLEVYISDDEIFTCNPTSKNISDSGAVLCTPINLKKKEKIPVKNSKLISSNSDAYKRRNRCHVKDKSEEARCDALEVMSLNESETREEMKKKRWKELIILSESGDSVVESPSDEINSRLKKRGQKLLFPSDSSDSVVESPNVDMSEKKRQVTLGKCKPVVGTRFTRQKCSIEIIKIITPKKPIPVNNENKCPPPKNVRSAKKRLLKGSSPPPSDCEKHDKKSFVNCTYSKVDRIGKTLRSKKKNIEELETPKPLKGRNAFENQTPCPKEPENESIEVLHDADEAKKSVKKSSRRKKCPFILD